MRTHTLSPNAPILKCLVLSAALLTACRNEKDSEDGGVNTTCAEGYTWGDDSAGPTWSASNNDGCPLDDPSGTAFYSPGARTGWDTTAQLLMYVR